MNRNPTDAHNAVRLLDELVAKAARAGASDLHLETKEHKVRVRMRIDGVMVDQRPLPVDIAPKLISRVKVLANMDIAEKRQPQDGTFTHREPGRAPISLRASTFPSVRGEKCVLRLLANGRRFRMGDLGLPAADLETLQRMLRSPGGLLLVTGPTGAGKTSSMYAMLGELDAVRQNVVTLEDPIELELSDVTQGQVHPKGGFTFANGLRAILRQDPDVILVGEMRDRETASIAMQAGLTGHLVLSTLHTNSAVDTIARLIDIGIESHIVANAVIGVVAQRLVRRLCTQCAVDATATASDVALLDGMVELGTPCRTAPGCAACNHTGYRGRVGVFEVVELDDKLRGLIKRQESSTLLRQYLREREVPTLRRAGLAVAAEGLSSLAEVGRVT